MQRSFYPDLVLRRAFSGINTPSLAASIDFGSNDITNVQDVEADQGQAPTLTALTGSDVSVSELTLPSTTVQSLTLNGDAATAVLSAQNVAVTTLDAQDAVTAQALMASGKSNIPTLTSSSSAAPANMYVSGALNAPNLAGDVLITDVLTASTSAEFQRTDATRLTLQIVNTQLMNVTGSCSGCSTSYHIIDL